jgi:hypothetical protein
MTVLMSSLGLPASMWRLRVSETKTSEMERLSAELTALSRQQYDALQKSSHAHMPKREADAYEKRLLRIIEIHQQLARFRAEGTKT